MKQYHVTGMSCAACSARVEKAVLRVSGVTSCSVSLLTNSMGVEGSADPQAVISAVEEAGYGASEKLSSTKARAQSPEDPLQDRQTPVLIRRFSVSLVFLLLLMYVSMGHTMWNFPLPQRFAQNPIALGLLQLLLTVAVMVINQRFFISGVKGLLHRAPNMDTLVSLGAGASFGYSVYALFAMSFAQQAGDFSAAHSYLHELYFESAAMILTLITLGKLLESKAKGRTTDALRSLLSLAPKTATVVRDGVEVEVAVEALAVGDLFVVRAGEHIPVDGVVVEGSGAVNEAALTGESLPIDKKQGDRVSAATVNQSGYLLCRATEVGEDTTLAQIIRMVSDAAATKAPISKIADRVSGVFVPVVMAIAAVTLLVWLLADKSIGFALSRAIAVLVISCPCALGLATPVAIMVGSGVGAKHGLLFKTAASLEMTGKTDILVLDKTGTVTMGEPTVTELYPAEGADEQTLLQVAYALEQKSEHPLSKAVIRAAEQAGLAKEDVTDFTILTGSGLRAKQNNRILVGGNRKLMDEEGISVSPKLEQIAQACAEKGKTALYFACNRVLVGLIIVSDILKPESAQAVSELQALGLRVIMLTGDHPKTAKAIAESVGIDEVIAGVLPQGKEETIRKLKQEGRVAMVGDGINDAPALTRADIGIAIGAGADVAMDAADVVLVNSRLTDVSAAIRLSRAGLRTIHQNLFWAFVYNSLGIPLAAGVFFPLWGWTLNPMFGAAAMSLSSFCVVSNALRLNCFPVRDASKCCKPKKKKLKDSMKNMTEREEQNMEIVLKIEGMMCPHCEAHVKKALEAIAGVSLAVVDHKAGIATVTLSEPVETKLLKKAVEDAGYTVL